MIPAVVLLILSGYFIVRGFLRERDFLPALTLGIAVSWGAFITVLNLVLRASVPFAVAAPLAAFAVLVLGIVSGALLRRRRLPRASLDRQDLALLLIGALPASALILLYHFLGPDGDDFIHYPLVALFLKGHFPHFNPYFPDLPLYGHYGRDLGLAGLVSFGGVGIGSAMILEAWLLHLATLGNIYFLARRSGAGRVAGAMATFFAFFAVNAGFADWIVRSGLAEVMGNYNPVVHAFLFAILNLAAMVLQDCNWWGVIFLALLLGGFDIVYETHFVIVSMALWILAGALILPSLRARLGIHTGARLAAGVALSLFVMLPAGGLTSRMVVARLHHAPTEVKAGDAYAWALAGAQQKVDVSFPKRPFLSLTHARDGRAVPLVSWEFLKGQGIGFWLFPISSVVLALRRRTLGLACALIALGSIAAPASLDFGRFNGENFRLIFFSGLMAAVCFGMVLGEGFAWLTGGPREGKRGYAWLGICFLAALLYSQGAPKFYKSYSYAQAMAFDFPHLLRISEAERLEHFAAEYGEGDEQATAYLASRGAKGDRIAANYLAPYQVGPHDLLNNSMVIMTRSQMPMVGFNARIMRESGGIQSSVRGWSARARAFWATGDEEILRDLGADWLYVVPKWLSPAAADGITRSKAVLEAFRSTNGERIVYRVNRGMMLPRPEVPAKDLEGLSVASVAGLDDGRLEQFVKLPLRLRNGGNRAVQDRAYVFYRIYDRTAGAPYDERDAVGTVHSLAVGPGREATLSVPFVFPYNEGDYEASFFARASGRDLMLGSFQFSLQPKT